MRFEWKQMLPAFLIGCLAGGAVGARCQRRAFHSFWRQGPDAQRLLKKFTRELSLDAGQQEAVRKIVEKHRAEVVALHQRAMARFSAVRMSMRAEIKKVLNPEQAKKFEAMTARWELRHKRLEDGQDSTPAN